MTLQSDIKFRQSRRKAKRKAWKELRSPDVYQDQSEFDKKRKAIRSEYFEECGGVDADLDLSMETNIDLAEHILVLQGNTLPESATERRKLAEVIVEEAMVRVLPTLSQSAQDTISDGADAAQKEADAEAKKAKEEADAAEKAKFHQKTIQEGIEEALSEKAQAAADEQLPVTQLPPADGFTPEDSEKEGVKPKRRRGATNTSRKKNNNLNRVK